MELNWWDFADYSVDELSPKPSCDQPSQHRKNSLSTEERAKFDQFNSKIYTLWGQKQRKNSTKRSRKTVDRSSGKVMCETCACFLCWTVTIHRKSYLKEAKSYLINIIRTIDLIGSSTSKREHPYDPDEHLAEHLMAFYWRGKLVLDEPKGLTHTVFSKASDALRGYALEFVGYSLYREKNIVPGQILARLQRLWEQRFKAVRSSTSHNADANELAAFGWGFSSEKFDKVWALAQLEATLQHNGRVEAAFMVVAYLAKLSAAMPLPVLKCPGLLIESDRKEWRTSTWHEQVREILAHAHQSSDVSTRQEAKKVAERLLAQGYPDYLVFTT